MFKKEAFLREAEVKQVVCKAVRNVTNQNQGVQEEVRSKLSEAVGNVSAVVDDAFEEPASDVGVRAKGVCVG